KSGFSDDPLARASAARARSIGVSTPPARAKRVPAPPKARHFRALRRDCRTSSCDTALSPAVGLHGGETRPPLGLFRRPCEIRGRQCRLESAQQASEPRELAPVGIRDGAMTEIAALPAQEMVALTDLGPRHRTLTRGPRENVDEMRAMLVDHGGRALMGQIVCAAAEEAIALLGEVGNIRRNIGVSGEPGR